MRNLLESPQVFKKARTKKGKNIVLEILIFLAVFIVTQLASGIILGVFSTFKLLSNAEFVKISTSGDIQAVEKLSNELLLNDSYQILTLFLTAIPIILVIIFCKFIQKRPIVSIGFVKRNILSEYIIGILTGFVIFSLAVCIAVISGGIRIEGIKENSSVVMLILFFLGFLVQGMSEEVLLRGYFMTSIARRYSILTAVITNSIVFAALHLLNSGISVIGFINLFIFGVFASVYYIKRGSIWGIAALHSIWNFAQGNFYGIRVSGMNLENSVLNSSCIEGKGLFNGAAFGLEGSICVTIVLIIGTVALLFTKNKKYRNLD